ncbi:TolB family protein [Actinomycetota bacterium]
MKKILIFNIIIIIIITLSLVGCIKRETPSEVVKTATIETADTSDSPTETGDTPKTDQETPKTEDTAQMGQGGRVAPVIIFMSSDGNISTIYICEPDGSNLKPLIDGGIYTSPSWNKEHSKIVFTSINPENGASSLYIYDMQSKSKTLLLERFSPIREGIPVLEKQYIALEPGKLQKDKGVEHALVPIRTAWLGIVDNVQTKIMTSNDDIFIPELSYR